MESWPERQQSRSILRSHHIWSRRDWHIWPSTEIRGHSKIVQLRLQLLQTKAIAAFPRCSRFAENIQRRCSHFRKFDKQYRSYEEKLHSLKARSDMPQGTAAFAARILAPGGRRFPPGSPPLPAGRHPAATRAPPATNWASVSKVRHLCAASARQ